LGNAGEDFGTSGSGKLKQNTRGGEPEPGHPLKNLWGKKTPALGGGRETRLRGKKRTPRGEKKKKGDQGKSRNSQEDVTRGRRGEQMHREGE